MSDTDLELLARYTRQHAEDAFAELVRRHVDLIHSAALRQVRSPQLAEEVTQSTFIKLARLAPQLAPDTILTAWLYQVTRREAIDVVRREARRQLREQIATEMNAMNATTADWTHIEPLLDEAVSALDDTDRAAVLLRYFENKSLREVGATLGTSDDAAQKRVSRAVERLREFFAKRGVSVGASGLIVVISANAVQAAPVGLAVTISTTSALAGTAVSTSTIIAATKTIAMTALQKTLVTATVAVLAGAGIYEARQASQLREQNQALQQQQAPLAEQNQQLQRERDDATNRLAGLLADNSRLKSNPPDAELLKLRGQVGVLQAEGSRQSKSKPAKSVAELAKSPEMREMMKASVTVSLDKVYAKLFADLNLTPEQASSLKQLITDKMLAGSVEKAAMLAGKMAFAGKTTPDQTQQLNNQINAEKTGLDDQIKQMLGSDGFTAYQAYEKTYNERSQIVGSMGFSDQLTGGTELTPSQTEQLVQAMAEERQQFKFTMDLSDPGKFDGDIATIYSDANISQYQIETGQLNQLYAARAQTILTPDQQTVFQKFLSNRLEMQKMVLNMSSKMLGVQSWKK